MVSEKGATAPQTQTQQATAAQQVNDALDAALANAEGTEPGSQGANYLTREEAETQLNQILNQVQGRAQNFYGAKVKETRDELLNKTQGEVNALINDLVQVLDPDQREALQRLRAERESVQTRQQLQETLDYVNKLRAGELQPGAPAQQMAMSPDEVTLLREEATDMLESSGVQAKPDDGRLWKDWHPGMNLTQTRALMRKNLRGLKANGAKPPAKPSPQAAVPPSLGDAPLTPAGDYATLGELAKAFRDKQIGINEYREIAGKKGWL